MLFVIKTWIHPAMRHQEYYREVSLYKQGKAEASNNLGFCAFMRMDFEQVKSFIWMSII